MSFPFSKFVISGNSMLPTYKPREQVLSFNWYYFFKNPQKGDVIVFKKDGRYLVKRIQKILGQDVFVEGDNQAESTDSREFGPIKRSQIIGKIVLVFSHQITTV